MIKFFGNESFAVAEELSTDGSNIVTLIREAYEVTITPIAYSSTKGNCILLKEQKNSAAVLYSKIWSTWEF